MTTLRTIFSFVSKYRFSILFALMILLISLLPGSSIPDSPLLRIPFMDKYIHFSMYTVFSVVAMLEMRCRENCLRRNGFLVLSSAGASLIVELIQGTIIEGRSADWTDLLANIAGLLAGWLMYHFIRRRFPVQRFRS